VAAATTTAERLPADALYTRVAEILEQALSMDMLDEA
jgi:hypothetical protein